MTGEAITFLLQVTLKGAAMCTSQTLLGHQLMKLSKLLSSSSDSNTKQAPGEECIHSFTLNPGTTGRHQHW